MVRFLTIQKLRRVPDSSRRFNRKNSFPEVNNGREPYTVGIPCTMYRLYSQYKIQPRGHSLFSRFKTSRGTRRNNGGSRNFSAVSSSNLISYHAHVAWKRLYHICTFSGPALPPISKIACAVSLALTRSNLVAPGVIAFLVGEFAFTQRARAEAEWLQTSQSLYMLAQDGQICFLSFGYALLDGVIVLLRAMYLTILFFPCLSMAPFADSLGSDFRKSWLHLVQLTLKKAGPAFIKWGQWAATRPDLFSRDLCAELSKLHTKAPTHSFSLTKQTIENAFGRKLTDIFLKFEEEPIASGSVAQVHRATMKYSYSGQQMKQPIAVAVKVRHPGVGEAIRRDFVIFKILAKTSNLIPGIKWLRLDETIQQFSVFMMSQVDLAREAAQLSRFIYNFQRSKDVSFPKPLYPLVHPAVLVETYEQGESISHYVDDLKGHGPLKSSLANIGTHALLKMLLVDNFIHADMHPGNILVQVRESKSSSQWFYSSRPHVVLLDVGMTAELSKRDRMNIMEFFKALALQDGRTAAESTLRLSKRQGCPNPRAFVEDVEKTFCFLGSQYGDVIHPGEYIQHLLEQVRHHKVNIDGNACAVIVTTLVVEGWQHKLDPKYDVMSTLQTLLFKADWEESLIYTIEGLMAP